MAANESTDPRVIAAGLETYRVAKQKEFAERAMSVQAQLARDSRVDACVGVPQSVPRAIAHCKARQ